MNLRICVKWTQPQVICLYVLQSHCIGPCLENAIHARCYPPLKLFVI